MKKPRAKRVKRPKHPGEVRAWRFALRLDQDVSALHRALDTAWALRNELAAARRENGRAIRDAKQAGVAPPARLTKRDQELVLAERRRRDPEGAGALHSLVVKNIADRIDEGWKRFWDALKERRPNVRPPKPVKRQSRLDIVLRCRRALGRAGTGVYSSIKKRGTNSGGIRLEKAQSLWVKGYTSWSLVSGQKMAFMARRQRSMGRHESTRRL